MCQTVIIANKIGSAMKYCFLTAHPFSKVVSKWLCPTFWSYSFDPSFPTLTNREHMPVLMQTLFIVCALHTHNCRWYSNLFVRVQLEQGVGRGKRIVLERNKIRRCASLTGVGTRKVSAHEVGAGKLCSFMKMWVIGTESNSDERAFVSFPRVIKPLSCGPTW